MAKVTDCRLSVEHALDGAESHSGRVNGRACAMTFGASRPPDHGSSISYGNRFELSMFEARNMSPSSLPRADRPRRARGPKVHTP
jgi:hypothetical protein